jgi:hypothetical protein
MSETDTMLAPFAYHHWKQALGRVLGALPSVIYRALGKEISKKKIFFAECRVCWHSAKNFFKKIKNSLPSAFLVQEALGKASVSGAGASRQLFFAEGWSGAR